MRQWLTPSTTLLSYSLSLLLLSVSISAPYLFLHLFFSILTPSHRLPLTLFNPSSFFLFLSAYPRTFSSFSFLTGFPFVYILLCSFCPFLFFHAKFLRFFCRRKLLDTLHFPSFFSYHGLSCFAMVEAKSAGTLLSKHRPHPRPQEISPSSVS